jgi:hypothetical protein
MRLKVEDRPSEDVGLNIHSGRSSTAALDGVEEGEKEAAEGLSTKRGWEEAPVATVVGMWRHRQPWGEGGGGGTPMAG